MVGSWGRGWRLLKVVVYQRTALVIPIISTIVIMKIVYIQSAVHIYIYFQSFLSEYIILRLFGLTSPIYKRDNIIAILNHNRQITTSRDMCIIFYYSILSTLLLALPIEK